MYYLVAKGVADERIRTLFCMLRHITTFRKGVVDELFPGVMFAMGKQYKICLEFKFNGNLRPNAYGYYI